MLSVKKTGSVSLVQRKNVAALRWVPGTQWVSRIRCIHTPDRCVQRVAPSGVGRNPLVHSHLTCYNALTYSFSPLVTAAGPSIASGPTLLPEGGTFVLKLTEGIRSISEVYWGCSRNCQ